MSLKWKLFWGYTSLNRGFGDKSTRKSYDNELQLLVNIVDQLGNSITVSTDRHLLSWRHSVQQGCQGSSMR